MSDLEDIIFPGNNFCFTGKLAELKREQAARETRARGGLTSNVVNEDLNYLVIGSIPSFGWKHGSYGNKIEKALAISSRNNKLQLISEALFMDGLAKHGELNSGEIDAKMLVYKYKFIAKDNEYNSIELDDYLELLHNGSGCYVNVYTEYASVYGSLFNESFGKDVNDLVIVQIRVAKQLSLEESSIEFTDSVSRGFESISGVDGSSHWFEKKEGTASYIRLLNEIPQNRRSTKI